MHRIAFVVAIASLSLTESAGHAQDRPILNPSELLRLEPEPTEFACVEHWDLPSPIGLINWRDFPPEGLIEVRPQRRSETGWVTGIPLGNGVWAGAQVFEYDEEGRVVTWTTAYGDFEDPADIQIRTSYTFSDSGSLVEVVVEVWRDGRWLNESRSSYLYQDDGQVSGSEFAVWDGADWDLRRTVDCTYDDAAKLTKRLGVTCPAPSFGNPNPPCYVSDSTAFVYDDLGRITEADRSTEAFRNVWRSVRTHFEYDGAGRLIEAVNPTNDPFIEGEIFHYQYDVVGRVSAQETNRDFRRRRTRYVYQHQGLLTRTADDTWLVGPDGWIEEGETRYEYGMPLALETVTRYGADPELWSQSQYGYDEEDRIRGEIRSTWTGAGWDQELAASYEYDASGLLISYAELWEAEQRQGEIRLFHSYAVGTASSDDVPVARSIGLSRNYPNPVRSQTTIQYTLDESASVRLTLIDALGRAVKSLDAGRRAPGLHALDLDASDLPAGVYLYRLEADGVIRTGSMVVAQ